MAVIPATDGYGNGTRMSWGDGKTQRLEDLLADVIAGSVRLAVDPSATARRS